MNVLLFDAGSTLATVGVLLVLFLVVVIVCALLLGLFAVVLPTPTRIREFGAKGELVPGHVPGDGADEPEAAPSDHVDTTAR